MLNLVLRVAAVAAFLATAVALTLSAGVVLAAAAAGRRRLARRALAVGGAWALLYAALVLIGPLLVARRTLAPAAELAFCDGIDCHLHVAVVGAGWPSGLEVRLRLRSDARQALEYPAHLRVVAIDEAGHTYAPVAGDLREPLAAGTAREVTLCFVLPKEAKSPRLIVHWGDWEDYLVPGPESALTQRRTSLLLVPSGATS